MKIKILDNPEYQQGSAHAKWFTAIKRYDGKDLDAFSGYDQEAACADKLRRA